MARTSDSASEERERLERFLEWRRATGRERTPLGWRWLGFFGGIVILGTFTIALAALLAGDLRGPMKQLASAPDRLANARPSGEPAQTQAAPAQDVTAASESTAASEPTASEPTPTSEPPSGVSLPERPSRVEPAERGGPRARSETFTLPPRSPRAASPRSSVTEGRSQLLDIVGPALPQPNPPSVPREILTTPAAPPAAPTNTPPPVPPSRQDTPSRQDWSSDGRGQGAGVALLTPSPPSTNPAVPSTTPAEPPVLSRPATAPRVAPEQRVSPPAAAAPRELPPAPPPPAERPITAAPAAPIPNTVTPRAASAPPPSPPAATTTPAPRPAPVPEVVAKPLPEPIESVKRMIDNIQDVKVGKAIMRWIKAQPPPDSTPPPPEPRPSQTR